MGTYVALACFTEQGLRNVKDTVKRADLVRESAQKFGVRVRDIVWTQGAYDIVLWCEADNDAAISAFSLATASAGNVRVETLRAFARSEMETILQKLG